MKRPSKRKVMLTSKELDKVIIGDLGCESYFCWNFV